MFVGHVDLPLKLPPKKMSLKKLFAAPVIQTEGRKFLAFEEEIITGNS